MVTRRHLLVSASAFIVAGCSRAKVVPARCDDVASLAEGARVQRTALIYVDHGPLPERTCERCSQWVAPADSSACGGCKLLQGPIHPNGTCQAFAAKT